MTSAIPSTQNPIGSIHVCTAIAIAYDCYRITDAYSFDCCVDLQITVLSNLLGHESIFCLIYLFSFYRIMYLSTVFTQILDIKK